MIKRWLLSSLSVVLLINQSGFVEPPRLDFTRLIQHWKEKGREQEYETFVICQVLDKLLFPYNFNTAAL